MATAAFAMPRRSAGTCWAMIFELPGNAMLSPRPSITRNTSSDKKPPANPISSVLAAQTITPIAISR